jgi:hypothetical protein
MDGASLPQAFGFFEVGVHALINIRNQVLESYEKHYQFYSCPRLSDGHSGYYFLPKWGSGG